MAWSQCSLYSDFSWRFMAACCDVADNAVKRDSINWFLVFKCKWKEKTEFIVVISCILSLPLFLCSHKFYLPLETRPTDRIHWTNDSEFEKIDGTALTHSCNVFVSIVHVHSWELRLHPRVKCPNLVYVVTNQYNNKLWQTTVQIHVGTFVSSFRTKRQQRP